MSHRLEDSHFLLLRATYLGKQRGKEAVKPDEEVRKEWPPAWHIPSLHKSDFMALSHAALVQAQTAGFILVHYRHLHKSQALLGWEFMQEIGFFRILPLLYISLLKRWMTALKPSFLVINSEGSVGIWDTDFKWRARKTHGWNLQVSLKNSCGFQESQGFSLFSFLSPLYLCSVRTRCSALQRDNQSCDPFQGELSSRWKEKQNKPEGKRWEIRSINPYLCFFVGGIYLLTLARVAKTLAYILPLFHPTSLTTVSHHLTALLHSFCGDFFRILLWFPDRTPAFTTVLLSAHSSLCLLHSFTRPLLISHPSSVIFYMTVWALCVMNNCPVSQLPANEDGESFTPSVIEPWAISHSKRNYDTKIGP